MSGRKVSIRAAASGRDSDGQDGNPQSAAAAVQSALPAAQPGRLFSNVDPGDMVHKPGTVFASASLVAGTTVGAGILALPYSTQVHSSA